MENRFKSDIKPCPCCGGKATLVSYPGTDWTAHNDYHCVRCMSCYLRTCDFNSHTKAIETWNKRVGGENDVSNRQ